MRALALALALFSLAFVSAAPADATVLGLVEQICAGKQLPYGREASRSPMGDRSVELSPGHPEYDQSVRLLPAPPPGWTADAPKITVFVYHTTGCGFSAARLFRKDERTLVVALTISGASALVREELAKKEPDIRPPDRLFEHRGRKGYEMSQQGELSHMLLVGDVLLMISGSASEPEKRALLEQINLDAIEALKP